MDPFLKEILQYWAETNFERQVTSEINFHEQSLWFNSLIRVDNKPIFLRIGLKKGKQKLNTFKGRKTTDFCPLMLLLQSKSQRRGPLIYKKLISTKGLTPSNSQNKTFQDCNLLGEKTTQLGTNVAHGSKLY